MDKFDDIRPYNDEEIRPIIDSMIADNEFIHSLLAVKFPAMPNWFKATIRPVVRWAIKRQVKDVNNVLDFQIKVEGYCRHMIANTMEDFTVSGLENLDLSKAHTFVSNHRDIALDPALVNYALHTNGGSTVRIAIGDNLLTKDWVTKLMRINKSFIVKRSAKAPRQLMAILKTLSEYINYSIKEESHPIWIAQREGRAKDGMDKTDPAIIKMMTLSSRKLGFPESVKSLNIVPVAISYEYDPCDQMKANELFSIQESGRYEKGEQEDVQSIAKGIAGYKGRVHLSFGDVLVQDFEDADQVSDAIDRQIIDSYVLQPSNYFAYYALYGSYPLGCYSAQALPFDEAKVLSDKRRFDAHMLEITSEQRSHVLNAYANPIVNKQKLGLL